MKRISVISVTKLLYVEAIFRMVFLSSLNVNENHQTTKRIQCYNPKKNYTKFTKPDSTKVYNFKEFSGVQSGTQANGKSKLPRKLAGRWGIIHWLSGMVSRPIGLQSSAGRRKTRPGDRSRGSKCAN